MAEALLICKEIDSKCKFKYIKLVLKSILKGNAAY